jgi:hypothetical protein
VTGDGRPEHYAHEKLLCCLRGRARTPSARVQKRVAKAWLAEQR